MFGGDTSAETPLSPPQVFCSLWVAVDGTAIHGMLRMKKQINAGTQADSTDLPTCCKEDIALSRGVHSWYPSNGSTPSTAHSRAVSRDSFCGVSPLSGALLLEILSLHSSPAAARRQGRGQVKPQTTDSRQQTTDSTRKPRFELKGIAGTQRRRRSLQGRTQLESTKVSRHSARSSMAYSSWRSAPLRWKREG